MLTVATSSVDGERFARLSFCVVPATFCFQIWRSTSCAQPGETVRPGDELTYEITVTKHAGSPATSTLTDNVPANTTYTGLATEGWGPSCVDLPALPAGSPCIQVVPVPAATAAEPGKMTVYFTVTVDDPLPPSTTEITNVVLSSEGTCVAPSPECTVTNPTPPELTTTKTQADVNAGGVTNLATVNGTMPSGGTRPTPTPSRCRRPSMVMRMPSFNPLDKCTSNIRSSR
jgi:uncharacterized repeat protein (TIGR01451 family)